MSLINEALKKAQNQRTNPPVTPPGTPPPTANSSAPQPSPFGKIGVLIAICAVIVSLSVLATVFLLRRPTSEPIVSALPATAPAPQRIASATTTPAPIAAKPTDAVSPAPTVAAATNTPANNSAKTSPASATATAANAAPLTASAIAFPVMTPTPTPSPEPTPVKPTIRIQALVDKFRISGIRISDTDSKVILNDHLFRVDDPVESSLGLRLTKIEEHRLTFVDADGNTYVKRF